MTDTQADDTAIDSEARDELRSQIRRFLERNWSDQQIREYADGNRARSLDVVSVLEGSMALNAIMVSQESGGLGGGCVEAVIAAEEFGAALIPSNLLGSVMTSYLLTIAAGQVAKDILQELTSKSAKSVVLWPGAGAHWTVDEIGTGVVEGSVVNGEFSFVPEADQGANFLAPARRGDAMGIAIVRQSANQNTTRISSLVSPDVFRPLSTVVLSAQRCDFLPITPSAYTGTVAIASILLAAEMVGGARACLERTVDYTSSRKQFGHPIATFQAVKHRIADVLVALESSKALTYRAADLAAKVAAATPDDSEYLTLARMAKASASDAFGLAAKECIQLHGGIGFTWENVAHFYLKKWVCSSRLYGQPYELRRKIYQDALVASN